MEPEKLKLFQKLISMQTFEPDQKYKFMLSYPLANETDDYY